MQVRVVDENGKLIGVLSRDEALAIARDRGYDLVEISPNADPPVCKIIDYGKFKYQINKKAQEAKKKQTVIQIKEIKLRPKTDIHDIEVKAKHIRRFIDDKDKVKISVVFRGRELTHKEVGMKVMEEVLKRVEDIAKIESEPKFDGKSLVVILSPKK